MMKKTTPFLCVLSLYPELRDRLPGVALGSVAEVLHGVLHGVLNDETGGAGSDFLGGSGDRVGAEDVSRSASRGQLKGRARSLSKAA